MKVFALLAFLLVVPSVTYAQTVNQIRRGTPIFFEHDDQSVSVTERYELCEDQVDEAHCKPILNVVRIGSSNGMSTFQFPLPMGVTNGVHMYIIRAFGEAEWSDPSSPPITWKITGKPLPPVNLRNNNTNPTGTSSTPTPSPAIVR